MYFLIGVISYLKFLFITALQVLKFNFSRHLDMSLENIALRSQLALYENEVKSGKRHKSKPTPEFRQTWIFLSKYWADWKNHIISFKPETIVSWHRKKFSEIWAKKSKKMGRPAIDREVINLIKKIHSENPTISCEKIHEQLALMGLKNPPAPNTIKKYLPEDKRPPTKKQIENWKAFLKNHMDITWATDFFTIPSLKFEVLYVLVIIEHGSRKIVHHAVTKNPNMFWLTQQFRNATPYGKQPKYLIHDNDPVFKSKVFQGFLESTNIKSKPTSFESPWQNPYAERVIGTIRNELLNHVIPFSERHLEHLLNEYIHDYYNTNRTHQGINGQTPIRTPKYIPVDAKDLKLETTPVLNGLYHTYKRAA